MSAHPGLSGSGFFLWLSRGLKYRELSLANGNNRGIRLVCVCEALYSTNQSVVLVYQVVCVDYELPFVSR